MVRMCHAVCRSALERAVRDDLLRTNPAIGCKLPPKKAKEMQVLDREELQKFLIQAQADGYYELFLLDLCLSLIHIFGPPLELVRLVHSERDPRFPPRP